MATSSHFGHFRAHEAFQLPIPGLFADVDEGAASVALPDEFLDLPGEMRVKVIQQWRDAMRAHEEAAIVEMFHEFAKPLAQTSIVEQLERFKGHCDQRMIACPSKIAVLLQRY